MYMGVLEFECFLRPLFISCTKRIYIYPLLDYGSILGLYITACIVVVIDIHVNYISYDIMPVLSQGKYLDLNTGTPT